MTGPPRPPGSGFPPDPPGQGPERVFDFEAPDEAPAPTPADAAAESLAADADTGVRTAARTAVGRHRHVRRRSRRRRRRVLASIAGAVVLIVLAFVAWYEVESHSSGPLGKQEVIEVQSGESIGFLVDQLSARHVIGSSLAFRIFDLVHGSPTLVPGHYALRQNESFSQVHAILAGGPNILAVTVDSGLTLQEVAQRVDDLPGHTSGQFARVAASGVVHSTFSPSGSDNLEGMLGTGTYLVSPGETDTSLLATMVRRFDAQATAAGLNSTSAASIGLTPYQVITAASIVEKEGYIPKNMPNVARVIYNRLAAGTPLQMNATVLYSLGQDGGAVTSADLKLQTPYNTYLNHGLTPTPICSPSPGALTAAVHPPTGSWLFFVVVQKDGTEAFADTFAEQQTNEKLAQQRGVG